MFLLSALLLAQTPAATATPSVPLAITWPDRVVISDASAADFAKANPSGFGTILLTVKCDGRKDPMIPPTPDIDTELRASLTTFVDQNRVAVGANCKSKMFMIRFQVPSGKVDEHELPEPAGR